MASPLQSFQCGVCGAARVTTQDALFIPCAYCGSLFDVTTQRWFDAEKQAASFERARMSALWTTPASARLLQIEAEMPNEDGPLFRALSDERHYLYALLHPEWVPASALASPKSRVDWATRATVMMALCRFDPEIAPLWDRFNEALSSLSGADTMADDWVIAARRSLEIGTELYEALRSHSEGGPVYFSAPALHYARMAVRLNLAARLAMIDDPTVWERVCVEVFKDRLGHGDECQQCGAPMPAAEEPLERCAFCAAVVERFSDDPWLKAKLALFTAAIPELQRAGTLDAPEAVLAALAFVQSALGSVGPARVAAFIRRAVPWLPTPVLEQGLALCLQHLVTPEVRPSFQQVISELNAWTPDLTRRPLPPVAPSGFDAAAWIEKSVVLLAYVPPAARTEERVVQAFSVALTDVLVAPVGACPPITPEHILGFFARVLPQVPRATLHAALSPISLGYEGTAAGPLVRELLAQLGR